MTFQHDWIRHKKHIFFGETTEWLLIINMLESSIVHKFKWIKLKTHFINSNLCKTTPPVSFTNHFAPANEVTNQSIWRH